MKLETHKDLFKHRDYALSLPGAVEDFPHGHSVIKVGKKGLRLSEVSGKTMLREWY